LLRLWNKPIRRRWPMLSGGWKQKSLAAGA